MERLFKEDTEPSCIQYSDYDKLNTSSRELLLSDDWPEEKKVEKFSYLDANLAQEDIDDAQAKRHDKAYQDPGQ